MQKHILEQKNLPPDSKLPCLLQFTGFRCLMPYNPKKWITARCSTAVQFENGAAIFKENA
jgi:hypothetical protein